MRGAQANPHSVRESAYDAATVNGTPVANIRPYAQGFCSTGPTIPDGMVLVTKESIQAAKAEAVTVADGVVYLVVSVLMNGDLTAETKNWIKAGRRGLEDEGRTPLVE